MAWNSSGTCIASQVNREKKHFKVFCSNSDRATIANPAYGAIFGYYEIFIASGSDTSERSLFRYELSSSSLFKNTQRKQRLY
jgi:hypothetical protein